MHMILIVVLVYSGIERMLVLAQAFEVTRCMKMNTQPPVPLAKKCKSLRLHEILRATGTDHHFDDIIDGQ